MKDITLDYMVGMKCRSCVDKVNKTLTGRSGVSEFDVDLATQRVTVKTTLTIREVTRVMQESDLDVLLRGISSTSEAMKDQDYGSGVCILHHGATQTSVGGLVRLYQVDDDMVHVEGSLDGLESGENFRVTVHELGDVSRGPESCGKVYGLDSQGRLAGDLGTVTTDNSGAAYISMSSETLKLWLLIGRSIVVSRASEGTRILCGVIARSAGASTNQKKVCACDGLTVWEEKERSGLHALL